MNAKKILAFILAFAMVFSTMSLSVFAEVSDTVSVWDGKWENATTAWYDENPNAEAFYLNSASDLAGLSKILYEWSTTTNPFTGKQVYLNVDVDLDNHPWIPIGCLNDGNEKRAFYGSFDGQGHTISNLKVGDDYSYASLFGIVKTYSFTQTFENLTIENVDIDGSSYAAALIGRANGAKVENVDVIGEINIAGFNHVGGLLGHSYAQISDCTVSGHGSITGGGWQVGGLVGGHGTNADDTTSIENCAVLGDAEQGGFDISASSGRVGGVLGYVALDAALTETTVDKLVAANLSVKSGAESVGYIASGYAATNSVYSEVIVVDANDEEITPDDASAVSESEAKIGTVLYATLSDAVAAATANDIIVLLDDVTVAKDTRWAKVVNIDLNDKTMYLTTSLTFNADATITNGTINADNVYAADGIIRADYHHGAAVTLTFKDVTVSAQNAEYSTGVFYLHSDDDKLILDNADVIVSGANDDPGSGVFYSPSSFKRGDIVLTNGTTVTAESVNAIFFASDAKIEDAVITGKDVYRPVFRQADGVVVNSEITIETMRDGDAVVEDVAGQNSGVVTFINSTVAAPEGTAFAKSNNEGSTVYADAACALSDETGVTAVKTVATASELVEAINNAKTGEFIFLSADIESDDQIVIPEEKKLTINLAGYDIVVAFAGVGVLNNGELTVMDTTDEGRIYTTNTEAQSRHAIANNGILTIEGGNFGSSASRGAALRNLGIATINGGSFTALDNYSIDNGFAYALINADADAVMTINDATVSGNMNGCVAADDGKVIINGGSYTLGDGNYGATLWNVLYSWKGEIIVNDGIFTKQDVSGASWVEQMVAAGEKGIVVNGGTFADTTHDAPAFQGPVDIVGPITVIGANETVIVDNAAPVALLFTDPDKNGSFDGKFYADVDEALAAATSGDTVKIGAGRHEYFFVPEGVTVEGTVGANGELLTTIYGENDAAYSMYEATVRMAKTATIKNLNIDSGWKGIFIEKAENILIENIKIATPIYGIHIDSAYENSVVEIVNCDIDCTWANSFGGAVSELVLTGNTFRGTQEYYDNHGVAAINTYAKKTIAKENIFEENAKLIINESAVSGIDLTENYFAYPIDEAFWGSDERYTVYDNTEAVNLFPTYADREMTTLSSVELVTEKTVANVSVSMPYLNQVVDGNDLTSNAKYEVSVTSATAGNEFVAYTEEGKKVVYFDISVLKNGVEMPVSEKQQVIVTMNTPIEGDITVKHWNGTAWEDVSATTAGNTVTFEADSFSPFAFAYGVATLATDDVATNITASLEKISDNEYNIILTGDDDKTINRFASAELDIQLVNDDDKGKVAMTVEGAGFVSVIDPAFNDSNLYEFNLDGVNAPDLTGNKLHIGTVKLAGYGEAELFLGDKAGVMVNTVKVNTNIVSTFIPSTTATEGVLTIDDTAAEVVLVRPTQALTVNITFPNSVEDNDADYQKMTITVSGSDLTAPITRELGGNAKADGSYSVLFADLTRGNPYTVTVSGDGYRTARYTVTMSENKILNFWNDLKVVAEEVEVGNDNYTTTTTFLAGDIVADDDINIYDLSAVVSYFGETNLKELAPEEYAKYVKYDLNRDGKIDSKDVAYVLASWEA